MIYFDNASTTKIDDRVLNKMIESYNSFWANPSSLHKKGFESEKKIILARKNIAKKLRISDKNLFFTPNATIANNTVISNFDIAGKNIIVSEIEHASISSKIKSLKCEVRLVSVDQFGFVILEDLLSKIDENTILISIIHVNNELGTINDINNLAKQAKKINSTLRFHSDGVQALNKIDISLDGIDFYTISAHKINGPKGVGALFVRELKSIKPLYEGGGQESGMFSGTENVQAIIGFGEAVELENNYGTVKKINSLLRSELEQIEESLILTPKENSSPYILNVCFKRIGAEILLHYLEMEDIYISTGSACNKGSLSSITQNLKIPKEFSNGCIRISMSKDSTIEEAKIFIEKIKEKIETIRRIIG